MGDSLSWCCCEVSYAGVIIWGDPVSMVDTNNYPSTWWANNKAYKFYSTTDEESFISGVDIPYFKAETLMRVDPFNGRNFDGFGDSDLPELAAEARDKNSAIDSSTSCSGSPLVVASTEEPTYTTTSERRWSAQTVTAGYDGGAGTYATAWGFVVNTEGALPAQDDVVASYTHAATNNNAGTLVYASTNTNPIVDIPLPYIDAGKEDEDAVASDGTLITKNDTYLRLDFNGVYLENSAKFFQFNGVRTRDLSEDGTYSGTSTPTIGNWSYLIVNTSPNPPNPTIVQTGTGGFGGNQPIYSATCSYDVTWVIDSAVLNEYGDQVSLAVRSNNDGKKFLGYKLPFTRNPSSGNQNIVWSTTQDGLAQFAADSYTCATLGGVVPDPQQDVTGNFTVNVTSGSTAITISGSTSAPELHVADIGPDGLVASSVVASYDPFTVIDSYDGGGISNPGFGGDTTGALRLFRLEAPISYASSGSAGAAVTSTILNYSEVIYFNYDTTPSRPLGGNPTAVDSTTIYPVDVYYATDQRVFAEGSGRQVNESTWTDATIDYDYIKGLKVQVVDLSGSVLYSTPKYQDGWKPIEIYAIPGDSGYYVLEKYYAGQLVSAGKRMLQNSGGYAEGPAAYPGLVNSGYDLTGTRGDIGDHIFHRESSILFTTKNTMVTFTGTESPLQTASYDFGDYSMHIFQRYGKFSSGSGGGSNTTDEWNVQIDHATGESFYLYGLFLHHLGVTSTGFGQPSTNEFSDFTHGTDLDTIPTTEGIYNKVSIYRAPLGTPDPTFHEDDKTAAQISEEIELGNERFSLMMSTGWISHDSTENVGTDHTRPNEPEWVKVFELWVRTELFDDSADIFSLNGLNKVGHLGQQYESFTTNGGLKSRLRKVDASFNEIWSKQLSASIVRPTEYGVVIRGAIDPALGRGEFSSGTATQDWLLINNDGSMQKLDGLLTDDINLVCDADLPGEYTYHSPVLLEDTP